MLVDTIRLENVNDLMFMWLIEITGWGIFNSVVMLDGRNVESKISVIFWFLVSALNLQ